MSAVIIANSAFREGRRQADAAFQNTRAWVKVETKQSTVSFVWHSKNGPQVWSDLSAFNAGNSPAFFVLVFPVLGIGHFASQETTKETCSLKDQSDVASGYTVFMKDNLGPIKSFFSGYWEDIENAYISTARYRHLTVSELKNRPDGLAYTLTTCVKYNIIGDKVVHHTGHVYQMGVDVMTPDGTVYSKLPKGSDVEAGKIFLMYKPEGDYAD